MGGTFHFANGIFRFSHVSTRFALALAHQQVSDKFSCLGVVAGRKCVRFVV